MNLKKEPEMQTVLSNEMTGALVAGIDDQEEIDSLNEIISPTNKKEKM